jgi:hypothetical protein
MSLHSLSPGEGYTLSSTNRSLLRSDHQSSHRNRSPHRRLQFRYRVTSVMKLISFAIRDFDGERYSTLSIGRAIQEKKKLGNLYRTLQTPKLLSTTSIVPIRTLRVPRTLDNLSLYPLPLTTLHPATPPSRCLIGPRESFPENHLGFVAPKPSLTSSFIFDPNT